VFSDFHINANDAAVPDQFAKPGIEHQGAAMGYAAFDDDIGLQLNRLLQPEHVFRQLDDGAPEPCEAVDIFDVPAGTQPRLGHDLKGFRAFERD
jgi:hypothetical protein